MGSGPQNKHPADEVLHALIAGDLDQGRRSAVEAHLRSCERCRDAQLRVAAVTRLFPQLVQQPEEARWTDLAAAVQARLQRELAGPSTTYELRPSAFGRFAPVAAVLAAAAVLLFVAGGPKGLLSPAGSDASDPARLTPLARNGVSGGRPAPEQGDAAPGPALGAWLALRGAPVTSPLICAEVEEPGALVAGAGLRAATRDAFMLQFEANRCALGDGRLAALEGLTGPDAGAWARAARGSDAQAVSEVAAREAVAREAVASAHGVAARDGVRGVRDAAGRAGRDTREGQALRAQAAVEPQVAAATGAPAAQVPGARQDTGAAPAVARRGVEHSSFEGETRVSVETSMRDPIAEKWEAASRAYYVDHDEPRALALADEIVEEGGDRREVTYAQEMRCEAYIGRGETARAVESCNALLAREGDPEAARTVHYRLATIYRVQLKDCRDALQHYNKAMVFGRATLLDDQALAGHAECALELCDIEGAKRDLLLLARHTSFVATSERVQDLKRRVEDADRPSSKCAPAR